MREFRKRLGPPERGPARRWVFVPYDQLSDRIGPLATEPPRRLGIVVVEAPGKAARRPYHRQKLALVIANLRHFALEQRSRGVAVRHVVGRGAYRDALEPIARDLGPLEMMEPAERELRVDLAPLVEQGALRLLPHEGWLTTRSQFEQCFPDGPPWRMDFFYRQIRRETGILMVEGKPEGGKFSFDAENRKPWRGRPSAPEPPRFSPDAVTREVGRLVETVFQRHPGRLDLDRLPATSGDADRLWNWALSSCLPEFGPYEDAMSSRETGLFHTRISGLVNLHRLLPRDVVAGAAASPAPLASREGFVRQVLGWREFVRHVHVATDGFRRVPGRSLPVAGAPGDGGYARWAGAPWPVPEPPLSADAGARPDFLEAGEPLPPAWWGRPSGLACLDRVVSDVWAEGWTHHIPRLMVLSNLATLLGVDPREVADWFWAAFTDAFDWVVEPNVLGMGTFAAGDVMTTKPYVSGGAYIDRMSDYCRECRFDPRSNCPVTALYWEFLEKHRSRLGDVPRLRPMLRGLGRRTDGDRDASRRRRARILDAFRRGREIEVADLD